MRARQPLLAGCPVGKLLWGWEGTNDMHVITDRLRTQQL